MTQHTRHKEFSLWVWEMLNLQPLSSWYIHFTSRNRHLLSVMWKLLQKCCIFLVTWSALVTNETLLQLLIMKKIQHTLHVNQHLIHVYKSRSWALWHKITMIVENCLHVVAEQFDRLGIVNIQWGVIIQDLLQLQAQIWHGQNNI